MMIIIIIITFQREATSASHIVDPVLRPCLTQTQCISFLPCAYQIIKSEI